MQDVRLKDIVNSYQHDTRNHSHGTESREWLSYNQVWDFFRSISFLRILKLCLFISLLMIFSVPRKNLLGYFKHIPII